MRKFSKIVRHKHELLISELVDSLVDFLLAYLANFRTALFSAKLLLHTSLEKLIWHNSYFFKVKTISSEQLLFLRGSFRRSHFLVAAIFSEYLIFLSKPSTEQPLFKNKTFFRPVTFWNSYFFNGEIASNKDIYKRAPLSKQAQHHLFQKSYIFEKALFFLYICDC